MHPFWEKVASNLRTGLAISTKKIEHYSLIGKLRLEMSSAKRAIDRTFKDMGIRAFSLLETDSACQVNQDVQIQAMIQKVKEGQARLNDLKAKLAEVGKKQGTTTQSSNS